MYWSGLANAAALVLVQTIFAAYTVLLSTAFHGSKLNAWVFALFRDVFGGSILMGAAILLVRRKRMLSPNPELVLFWPAREDLFSFVVLGFLCLWGQGLYATAVSLTTSDFTTLMQPLQPVVAFVTAVLVGIEPFVLRRWESWAKAASVLLAVGGAAYVVLQVCGLGVAEHEQSVAALLLYWGFHSESLLQSLLSSTDNLAASSKNLPLGSFYIALQVSFGGLYPVFMKPMLKRYDPLVLVAWAYVFGAFFIALSVLTCATTRADWSFSPVSWAAIAYSAVFSSAVAYFLMAWVNERSSPIVVSAFYPVQPIATIPLSWAVLGQVPAPSFYIGGVAVCVGLFLLLWVRSKEEGSTAAAAAAAEKDAFDLNAVGGEEEGWRPLRARPVRPGINVNDDEFGM